ncbi:phosphoribosylglycinamide formyltransferase [Aggregatibacter actinomycetemcomitans]|uniref:phosphoribosylglycinamide formyltransferase n=1 Tax=Aggregatibacter actinomycetemcomitans TaxID=714 RepID=UPI0011D64A52|nr:phosphoribosylglycinamide formyltransferase [Aggregatibacter actinomycetemcomitans]TYA50405.1 phosphoribosylglycinamide formyltransferase [Aggregatibacter actinomycetemcomitans]TYB27958.1 phosphoribosylglycinamide formyltransferase [Aggregatibacter actinomycetemcomitans]
MKKIIALLKREPICRRIDACKSSFINDEIVGMFSNNADAFGLQQAKSAVKNDRTFSSY